MKVIVVASLTRSLFNFRFALLRKMVENGCDVVACAPDDDPQIIEKLTSIDVKFVKISMDRAKTNPLSDIKTLRNLVSLYKSEKPDLVLAYTQKPIIWGGIAARLAGIDNFYAMNSGLGYVYSPDNKNTTLIKFVSFLYRLSVARAKAVFVFNRDDPEDMVQHGILDNTDKVIQVPGSGVDLTRFPAKSVPDGPMVFLMVARLLRAKGVAEYAAAAKIVKRDFPDSKFHLVGGFDANPSCISKEELDEWTSEGVIDYFGEQRDVVPFLSDCTVYVLPTILREGLPRSVLEAMAIGRAIITTDVPGCREPIIDGENGFMVPPKDPQAIANAMIKFSRDPSLSKKMGERSLHLARTKYAVEIVNEQLLNAMKLDRASIDNRRNEGR